MTIMKLYTMAAGLMASKQRQAGVTMIEYALIAALIAIVAIAVLTLLGPEIAATFQTVLDEMQNANGTAP
jgi:pilus assembly protein Flp/PilA